MSGTAPPDVESDFGRNHPDFDAPVSSEKVPGWYQGSHEKGPPLYKTGGSPRLASPKVDELRMCCGECLALPHSGWLSILKLTCWICGIKSSTLELERAWAHQFGEPE